jgi:xeroderma pigmentosum group C-complementing protein
MNVETLKSAENWLRTAGRTIRVGQQPLKLGKIRATTMNKKRAVEMAMEEASVRYDEEQKAEGLKQGLYAEWQTELFVADPVVDVCLTLFVNV